MTKPLILVTGATGKTGAAVVRELRARDWPVRAVVRLRDDRALALESLGAQTVVANIFDHDQMYNAMRGAVRAYYLPPFHPRMIDSARIFATIARDVHIESITALGQWLASPSHPALETRQLWEMEQLFTALQGVNTTMVLPGFFADNYLRLINFAAQLGVLPSMTGDSLNAPPSNEDIARVAVEALIDPDRHAGRSYRPAGPALLSTADMAAILTSVLGRQVRRIEMPMWLFLKAARMQNVSAFEMSGFRYWVRDQKLGAFEFCGLNDHVRQVTGRAPEDFETITRRYAKLPQAQSSFALRARAWFDFMRTPMTPGYNLNRFDRENDAAPPADARFAMQDPQWREARRRLTGDTVSSVTVVAA